MFQPKYWLTLFIGLWLVGCVPAVAGEPQPETATVTVFAAASLTDAFAAVADDFEAHNAGIEVVLNFAGSQVLRLQIEQGARADVFASADEHDLQPLLAANLVELPLIFAHNQLVVITPAANPANLQTLADLTRPGLKLVLGSPEVPVGRYARQALTRLNGYRLDGYGELPDDFSAQVLANLVSEEDNVKGVLGKIQLGEADAGIVYASDVAGRSSRDTVTIIPIAPAANVVARYPIVRVAGGPNPSAAQQFIDYVVSPAGQAILAEAGLTPAVVRPASLKLDQNP